MVFVLASITVKKGRVASFVDILNANIPKVLAEDGCIEYNPVRDLPTDLPPQIKDEHVITIVEKWDSLDHLYAHLKAPHMLDYKSKVADLVDNVSLKVLQPV